MDHYIGKTSNNINIMDSQVMSISILKPKRWCLFVIDRSRWALWASRDVVNMWERVLEYASWDSVPWHSWSGIRLCATYWLWRFHHRNWHRHWHWQGYNTVHWRHVVSCMPSYCNHIVSILVMYLTMILLVWLLCIDYTMTLSGPHSHYIVNKYGDIISDFMLMFSV